MLLLIILSASQILHTTILIIDWEWHNPMVLNKQKLPSNQHTESLELGGTLTAHLAPLPHAKQGHLQLHTALRACPA